ncbi:MAG: pseudouridine synthase [Caldilineaceae bacterium]
MAEERLHKLLAAAGVASRRAAEQMIVAGRVQVNGHTITELGYKVDPGLVQIQVDGKPVHLPKRHQYIKLHKPRGILSDVGGDTGDRETVVDLLPAENRRLFPVGRLDLHSEGLILLTDDGELAHNLTHPRYQHTKTYYVLVGERPTEQALEQLRRGVDLPDGRTAPAEVRVAPQLPPELRLSKGPTEGVWLEMILREGKKRQIRHMTAAVGYPTLRLVRWAIGSLTLGDLKLREHKPLSQREVTALRAQVSLARTDTQPGRQSTQRSTPRGSAQRTRPAGPLTRSVNRSGKPPARPMGKTGRPSKRR